MAGSDVQFSTWHLICKEPGVQVREGGTREGECGDVLGLRGPQGISQVSSQHCPSQVVDAG